MRARGAEVRRHLTCRVRRVPPACAAAEAVASIKPASEIVREDEIHQALAEAGEDARNPERVREILARAKDRALLKHIPEAEGGVGSEFVQGLSLREAATLLNVDSGDEELMRELFETSLFIKELIYGNRLVLFAPLYLANHCVNTCTYCAYRGGNKHIPRKSMTNEELRAEVEALERQGHRRLLLLTGEHPKVSPAAARRGAYGGPAPHSAARAAPVLV